MKNYTLKVIKKGSNRTIQTHKKRRFYKEVASLKNSKATFYLRIYYGRFRDVFGKLSEFYNDGYYSTKKELVRVLEVFDEVIAQ